MAKKAKKLTKDELEAVRKAVQMANTLISQLGQIEIQKTNLV